MNDDAAPMILVVDDDPIIRVLCEETLRGSGFDVVTRANGLSVIEDFDEIAPDAVLLDVEMPGMDGFKVCQALQNLKSAQNVPIIMVTAHDDAASVNRAFEAGAKDFINKPIPWPVLPYRIHYVLRAKQALKELQKSERRNRVLLNAIPDQIFVVDENGELVEYLSSTDSPAKVGDTLDGFLPLRAAKEARHFIQEALSTGEIQTYEHNLGEDRGQFETRLIAQSDNTVLAIIRDITDRKLAEAKVNHLAYHDNLTGLPNRQD